MTDDDKRQIETIRAQTLNVLQELVNAPKPSYWVDNYKFSWNEYHARLTKTVDWCDKKLKGGEPFEFRSVASN